MITRHAWPGWEQTPELPPPMCHVHPADRTPLPARGGLAGGAVVLTGLASTPGGSSGYGYLGMDITDPASWPRPFRPQQTTAWFVRPPEVTR
jgi:hypothetical protein